MRRACGVGMTEGARGGQGLRRGRQRNALLWGGALSVAAGLCLAVWLPAANSARSQAAESAAAAGQAAGPITAKPKRIVSLNPCIDAVLMHVADRGQIAAVSHFSHDPQTSAISHLARQFPATYETAEEVLLLKPDLVLASLHTAPATRRALEKMNIPVKLFEVPNTVEDSLRQVKDIAQTVGHPARGEALVSRIEGALATLPPPEIPIPTVILQAGGFAPGQGNLQDDLLRRVGMENVAARYGVNFWGVVPLELLVSNPPRLLLAGDPQAGTPAVRDRVLAHPVLRRFEGRMAVAYYPPTLLYCGGPAILDAVGYLAKARLAVEKTS